MVALALTALAAAAQPPVTVDRIATSPADRIETRLVARDERSGRRFVLARARLRGRGTHIGGYSVVGRRVVYVKSRKGRRLTVVRLHVVRVGPRRIRRLGTLRLFRRRDAFEVPEDAIVTSRGELAWLTPDQVVVRRSGRRPRMLARGTFRGIALEDHRTLRLLGDTGWEYIDLRPGREPSCGGRSRFRPVLETPELVVTEAFYPDLEEPSYSLRVCRRADGRDPVVGSTFGLFPDGASFHVVGAIRDWAVIVDIYGARRGASYRVFAAQAGTGRRGLSAGLSEDRPGVPSSRLPFAVSDGGLVAWVSERDGAERLVTPTAGIPSYQVLDTGGPGSLRDLAFTGTTLTWTHDGVPRSGVP